MQHLSDAVLLSEHLGELADHLIGHFVDQARRAGSSWTEIGQSMGVSRQAAQKRFVPKKSDEPALPPANIFARFTPRARNTTVAAQGEARRARHEQVEPEHVLLALLTDPEGLGARAIMATEISLEQVRDKVTAALGPPCEQIPNHIPFAPRTKKLLELTMREALRLGHNYIGTEHILLGILGDEDAAGATILTNLGATREKVGRWIAAQPGGLREE